MSSSSSLIVSASETGLCGFGLLGMAAAVPCYMTVVGMYTVCPGALTGK